MDSVSWRKQEVYSQLDSQSTTLSNRPRLRKIVEIPVPEHKATWDAAVLAAYDRYQVDLT